MPSNANVVQFPINRRDSSVRALEFEERAHKSNLSESKQPLSKKELLRLVDQLEHSNELFGQLLASLAKYG